MTQSNWRTPFVILVCGTSVLLLVMGVRMTYGLWLQPATSDLGWNLEVLSLAMALQALFWGIGTPFAGIVADRYGAGRVVAFAGCMFALGLVLMSQATTPLEAYFSVGFLTGIAMSSSTFPIILSVVSRSVTDEKRRAVYVGITSAGGSAGMFVMVVPVQFLVDGYGWIVTLLVLAAVTALLVPLSSALAGRNPAANTGERQSVAAALREAGTHRGYILLTAGYFVCGFQTLFISDHFPTMLRGYDVSAEMGAIAIALIGGFNILGSFLFGSLGGWMRRKYLLCWIYVLRSVAMVAFILLPVTDLSVVVFASVMGIFWLGTVPLTGAIVGQIFGFRYMATLFGICFVSHQVGSFLGIWAGGLLYDIYGNYNAIWWAAIALGLVAALLNYPIDDRPVARVAAQQA